jgi:hypothetical protein
VGSCQKHIFYVMYCGMLAESDRLARNVGRRDRGLEAFAAPKGKERKSMTLTQDFVDGLTPYSACAMVTRKLSLAEPDCSSQVAKKERESIRTGLEDSIIMISGVACFSSNICWS